MQNKEVGLKTKKICNNCGSGETYLRISTLERVCRQCGFIDKLKIEVKK